MSSRSASTPIAIPKYRDGRDGVPLVTIKSSSESIRSRTGSIKSLSGSLSRFGTSWLSSGNSFDSSSYVRPTGLAGNTRLSASVPTDSLPPAFSRRSTNESIESSEDDFVEPTSLGNKPTKGGLKVGNYGAGDGAERLHARLDSVLHTPAENHIKPASLASRIQRHGKVAEM